MLDFLAAEYTADLIKHCCFCLIFTTDFFVFQYCYVGTFVLKCYVADEKVVDCKDIGKMLSTVIANTISKTTNTIVTGLLFDFFPTLVFQSSVKNISDFFLISLRTVLIACQRFAPPSFYRQPSYMARIPPFFILFLNPPLLTFFDNISPMKYGINKKITLTKITLQNNITCLFARNAFIGNNRLRLYLNNKDYK